MGLLSDIYSWGDTKKRELKGLLADPVGMLEKTVGQLQDSAKERGSLMQQAGWGITSPSTATPEQQRIAQQILADQGAQQAMAAATVWHGSPHKFDKFDSSKIGTGEGAQAYGHGIYTAEAKDVAQGYADSLRNNLEQLVEIGKKRGLSEQNAQNLAREYQKGTKFDPLIEQLQKTLESPHASDAVKASAKSALDQQFPAYEAWNDWVRPGHLYKVDLPDEHIAKMLDWDKPLSQQHPDVQKMLEPLGYSSKAQVSKYEDDLLSALYGDSSAPLQKIRDPMGSDIARGGGVFDGKDQIKKANRLKELGIPGIRYLDGGSRGTGQGTSNFVIFPGNEGLLKILERNGQALK